FPCRLELRSSDARLAVEDLALEVALVDAIEVDEAQTAHAGRGQVERERRAEATGADDQRGRSLETPLPIDSHLGEHEMAVVAQQLVPRELGKRVAHGTASPASATWTGSRSNRSPVLRQPSIAPAWRTETPTMR